MHLKNNVPIDWEKTLWVLILLSLVIHLILSLSNTPGFWTDSFIYLLQADYFNYWNDEHLPVLDQALAYRNFPPLYPYFLSLLGAGSNNIMWASVATSFLLVPTCIFYIYWQIKEGVNKRNALINALLFLMLPATILFSTELWSENLYLLFVFLSIWSFPRSRNNSGKWLYFSALCCGLAFITRSVGIALVFALLISVYRYDKRRILLTTLIMLAPWLIWRIISDDIDYSDSYIKNALLGKYQNLMGMHENAFYGLYEIAKMQLQTLWWGLQLQFNNSLNAGTVTLATIITVATGYSLYQRLLSFSLDAMYVVFYLGIIFIWNFPDHNVRFIYVIIPFILFYSQFTVTFILKRLSQGSARLVNLLFPAIMAICILPSLVLMTGRFITIPGDNIKTLSNDRIWLTGVDPEKMYKQLVFKKELIEAVIEIKKVVPEQECVYSLQQEIVMLYAQRRTIIPPLQQVNQEDFINNLTECRYMFIVGSTYNKHEALYPVDRVKNISWVLQQRFFPSEYEGEIISVLLEIEKNVN